MGIKQFQLSQSLMDHLHRRNLGFLRHIYVEKENLDPSWLSEVDLGLSGEMATELGTYINNIYGAGIDLSLDMDKLVWVANKHSGVVTTNLSYLVLLKHRWIPYGLW